jgi:hypothetical protein
MPRLRSVRATTAVVALALSLAPALAGCGGDDAAQVRATLAAFQRATARRDFATLCANVLSKQLVQRIEQVGLSCEGALRKGLGRVSVPRLRVERVTFRGAAALALVRSTAANQPPSTDTIRLVREGGRWRIAALSGRGSTAPPPAARAADE